MTANLDILTHMKTDVIAIPTRSVYSSDIRRLVQLVNPKTNKSSEREVTTGIRGIDGYIEVTSGLNVGDIIVASQNL